MDIVEAAWTPERAVEMATRCREVVSEDCQQDRDYLKSIVDMYVDGLGHGDMVLAICSDSDMWPDVLPFNPETGEPWLICDDCGSNYAGADTTGPHICPGCK